MKNECCPPAAQHDCGRINFVIGNLNCKLTCHSGSCRPQNDLQCCRQWVGISVQDLL